jgi:hypothetical protein
VGNNERPVTLVPRGDSRSREKERPRFVVRSVQVINNIIEAVVGELRDVFSDNPTRSHGLNDDEHGGPQMARIVISAPVARRAPRLAREAPGNKVNCTNGTSVKGMDVVMDGHLREVLTQHLLAVRINLAVENGAEARPLRRQREAADTRKQIDVGGLHLPSYEQ